jgi:hypothetical protein
VVGVDRLDESDTAMTPGPSPALAALNAERARAKAKSRALQAAAKEHADRELIELRGEQARLRSEAAERRARRGTG